MTASAPPLLDVIFDGFLAGTVGVIECEARFDISFFLLELAYAVACGTDTPSGDALDIKPQGPGGRVVFFTGEGGEDLIWEKQEKISAFLPSDARKHIVGNLDIISTFGADVDFSHLKTGPSNVKTVADSCAGSRLVIFESSSCYCRANLDRNSFFSRGTEPFECAARATGAAVLLVHNGESPASAKFVASVGPMSRKEAQDCGVGEACRSEFVSYEPLRANYAALPPKLFFKREQIGVLTHFRV